MAPGASVDRPALSLGAGRAIAVEEVVNALKNRQRTAEFVDGMGEEFPFLLQNLLSIGP
jgi:hypothetical protein